MAKRLLYILLLPISFSLACNRTDAGPYEPPLTVVSAPIADSATSEPASPKSAEAWVCKSVGAKKYHYNRDCGGLGRCKREIEKIAVVDARAVGLTQCAYKKCR